MVLNLRLYQKTVLDLVNTFSKVAGYKINIHKLVAFPYTKNDHAEKEIRKTIPFTIALKNKTKKSPVVNLTKEMKDLYNEQYKTLKKGMKLERPPMFMDQQN
jgi:hypothetical protein